MEVQQVRGRMFIGLLVRLFVCAPSWGINFKALAQTPPVANNSS